MIEANIQNKHSLLSVWITACGLLYIFAYQFSMPFPADVFLYGMLAGLVMETLCDGRIFMPLQFALMLLIDISAVIGLLYTTRLSEGIREAILFVFFTGLFVLSLSNQTFIKLFVKWVYLISVAVVLSSILHFLMPDWFNSLMRRFMKPDAYEQLMWSYTVDGTYAGLSAYTPNTTFSAAIVFGHAFLCIVNKDEQPIIKNKLVNIVLLVLSMCSIILCSKRGIFVATLVSLVVLIFFLYRKQKFIFKFLLIAILFVAILTILYQTNEFVEAFLNRFVSEDITGGRATIYTTLLRDFQRSNTLIGRGTSATYALAEKGAHNIYIQVLYDHGFVFSIPYYVFLIYNYYIAFKNKCPHSIFVQTLFLVYGLSGNPLYSNMFVTIYLYYVLYAMSMRKIEKLQ